MCIYVNMYICIFAYRGLCIFAKVSLSLSLYIYIYIERERYRERDIYIEREIETAAPTQVVQALEMHVVAEAGRQIMTTNEIMTNKPSTIILYEK